MQVKIPSRRRLARILKALRRTLGLKVIEIARYAGKSQKTIHRWEKQSSDIMNDSWIQLVRSLEIHHGITEDDLFANDIEYRLEQFRTTPRPVLKYSETAFAKLSRPILPTSELAMPETGFLFARDFLNPVLEKILLREDDRRFFTREKPPFQMKDTEIRHLLGDDPLPEIPNRRIRRFILEPLLPRAIGLRKIEVAMLAELKLPEWCCTPQVLTDIVMAYREALERGIIEEKRVE